MSEEDTSAEKSFDPTPKRLEEARKKGEFAKSVDLHTAAAYAGLLVFMGQFSGLQLTAFTNIGAHILSDADALSARFLNGSELLLWGQLMMATAVAVGLIFLLPALGVLISLIGQRAIVVAPNRLTPQLSRLSLLANAKQKFGRSGWVEFFKSFVKMVLIGTILVWFLMWHISDLIALIGLTPGQIVIALGWLLIRFMALVLVISLVIGVIDYLWQSFEHLRKHRMSRQELVEENKQSEGDPHLKSARRAKAQAVAMNQMLQDIPQANVVIVNPTHYAVALKWTMGDRVPPICVAKGIDAVAKRIREVAMENGVPIRHDPPTARVLHASIEIGQPIDRAQYEAVAAAIRFADDMRKRARERPWAR